MRGALPFLGVVGLLSCGPAAAPNGAEAVCAFLESNEDGLVCAENDSSCITVQCGSFVPDSPDQWCHASITSTAQTTPERLDEFNQLCTNRYTGGSVEVSCDDSGDDVEVFASCLYARPK